ncbi:hypothetical protein TC41_2554 [Alicyclobacillus acidocaldarius subsp. acidocaldarius Tc-4-1]|uniref:Uncharacterized protein n=1 Tax=Alicyclobacillus acidocaldarius (strain Tc-4-1) TaxID=1048834 RepID=F8IHH7_ALIAT|nr:hypothetical protein TC41_2554 [Alicyclobacillus acidocaldarius subsp. acidocaldarius Tc-4-1]
MNVPPRPERGRCKAQCTRQKDEREKGARLVEAGVQPTRPRNSTVRNL